MCSDGFLTGAGGLSIPYIITWGMLSPLSSYAPFVSPGGSLTLYMYLMV